MLKTVTTRSISADLSDTRPRKLALKKAVIYDVSELLFSLNRGICLTYNDCIVVASWKCFSTFQKT